MHHIAAGFSIPQPGFRHNRKSANIKNSYTAAEQRRRNRHRDMMRDDPSLSDRASRLGWKLDWHAGTKGYCWHHQTTLAAEMRCSVRSIQRAIEELVASGHIRVQRTVTGNRYVLAWRVDLSALKPQCATRERGHTPPGAVALKNNQERTTTDGSECPKCDGFGRIGGPGHDKPICECKAGAKILAKFAQIGRK